MLRLHLAHIDQLDRLIAELDAQIEVKPDPFVDDVARLQTVTGIGPITAQVLIAEIGVDMSVFPTLIIWRRGQGSVRGTISRPGNRSRDARTRPAPG